MNEGHSQEKYTTGVRLASSQDRSWSGLVAELWSHKPGDLGATQPRDTEVVLLVDGAARVRRRGDGVLQEHDATQGTLWLCPAGIAEDMIHLSGSVSESLHLFLPASPLSVGTLTELGLDPSITNLRYDGGFRNPLIEQIGLAIRQVMLIPGAGDRLFVESLTAALCVQLYRDHSNVPADRLSFKTQRALTKARLDRVCEYVEASLGFELGLDALARVACLSPYHFARAFKAATGLPPHRFVVMRRIERAKGMLEQQDASLAHIAAACGFSSQSHLTRCFRQVTGHTPASYRQARSRGSRILY